jgi:hypothetical protein
MKRSARMCIVQNIELERRVEMPFNYNKLSGKIVEVFGTRYNFAKAMGWSERTLSLKMSGKRSWKQSDICKAINLLNLTEGDIPTFFFTPKVQNI